MNIPKYEVYPSGTEWRWRLRARNGEVMASGEGYKRKAGALRGVEAHRKASAEARVVVLIAP